MAKVNKSQEMSLKETQEKLTELRDILDKAMRNGRRKP
jgi:hypothetical protein